MIKENLKEIYNTLLNYSSLKNKKKEINLIFFGALLLRINFFKDL